MDNFRKIIRSLLKEELLRLDEGISNILYHFTSIHNAIQILAEDKFHASTNIGSPSDLNTSKGKFFFFSTTRSRSTGYKRYGAKLVLDGRKLSQRYEGFPIDYWQYSKNPKDYGDTDNDPKAKNTYIQSLQSGEQEDRIILDQPIIPDATKYIKEIHCLIQKRDQIRRKYLDEIIEKAKYYNIPLYFYDTEKYYFSETKSKSVNPYEVYQWIEDEEYVDNERFLRGIERIIILLSHKNPDNFNKIVDRFQAEMDEITMESLKKQTDLDNSYYLKPPHMYGLDEYYRVISAEIHNMRTKTGEKHRFLMKMLADDMKKNGAKTLKDYVDFKAKGPVASPQ